MMRRSMLVSGLSTWAFILSVSSVAADVAPPPPEASTGLDRIQHIVVIYDENRSFDNLYGLFPGADGIRNARPARYIQRDRNGKVLRRLPPVWHGDPPTADPDYRSDLPNKPFRIDDAAGYGKPLSVKTRDLVHKFYQQQEQIDGGKLDRFAAVSDAGGLTMGHYDGSPLKMWKIAQRYTLADHFFMGAFGGSYLNHQWLICACTPEYRDAPAAMRAKIDARGWLVRAPDSPATLDGPPKFVNDGSVTPDGYSVNTTQSPYQPSGLPPSPADSRFADPASNPLPPQHALTIGDTLSAKGVSWAWYSGAWNVAVEDGARPMDQRHVIYKTENGAPNFQAHHQPFNYFAVYAPGTPARAEHLKDGDEFLKAIDAGTLPAVAFYKPQGNLNQHPGYANVQAGDDHAADLIAHLEASPQWSSTVVIVTYDENGGFWDHVPPPKGDRWGPGLRIATIIISPFARRHFVDHTMYDTTSIIKFITKRFGLQPLPGVRRNAGDLTNALDLRAH
jgi:acid phosphatase